MKYLYKQFKTLLPIIFFTYVPTLSAIIAVIIYAFSIGKHPSFFTEHPFVSRHLPYYAGILTYVTILLWCATAAICFFCAMVISKDKRVKEWRIFLFVSGLFTSLLMFDDLFQMHNIFYPKYLNLPTVFVYGIYGIFAVCYLVYFRKQILKTEFLLLAFSLLFFTLSIIFDKLPLLPIGSIAFSDGLKLFGTVNWIVYLTRISWKTVNGM